MKIYQIKGGQLKNPYKNIRVTTPETNTTEQKGVPLPEQNNDNSIKIPDKSLQIPSKKVRQFITL